MKFPVAIRRCDPRASDEEVIAAVLGAADDLPGLANVFAGKRKVMVKPNIGTDDVRTHLGRQVALTDPAVLRATVLLIRRYFDGEIVIGEATTGSRCHDVYRMVGHRLDDLGVRVVDLKDGPFAEFPLPTGLMFDRYFMSAEFRDVDLTVSVAKMKSHLSTGATLCLKNLFGMTPTHHYGSPRRYLHAPVRLPRVLVDVAQLFPPGLCVIDGLVGQDRQEWHGPPTEPGVVMVGTNVVATDATAMRLMGMDPELDYRHFPYHFDRNPLVLAGEVGLGSTSASDVELFGDVPVAPRVQFTVAREHTSEVQAIREGLAVEIDRYKSRRVGLLRDWQGQFVALAEGEVVAGAPTVDELGSRTEMARRTGHDGAILIKQVLPRDREDERLEVYEAV